MSEKLHRVAIIAPYTSLPGEPRSNRFRTIAEMLSASCEVCLVTSRFEHSEKKFRKEFSKASYEIELLWEPGYPSNTSLRRVFSHFCFLICLFYWLALNRNKYTHFLCAVPFSLSVVLCKLICRGRVVADVQDVWPESFLVLRLGKVFKKIIGWTEGVSRLALKCADSVVTVSSEFSKRCEVLSPGCKPTTVYLGSEIPLERRREPGLGIESADVIRLVYLGTLGSNYDLGMISEVVERYQGSRIFHLYLVGDGPRYKELSSLYSKSERIFLTGYMKFDDMVSFSHSCHFGVNPIVFDSSITVTNKVSDYFAIGIPFISGQNSAEVTGLVSNVEPRLCYKPGTPSDFENVLRWIESISDNCYAKIEGRTRDIGEEKFIRKNIYKDLIRVIFS